MIFLKENKSFKKVILSSLKFFHHSCFREVIITVLKEKSNDESNKLNE
jgi:hypothetical protein